MRRCILVVPLLALYTPTVVAEDNVAHSPIQVIPEDAQVTPEEQMAAERIRSLFKEKESLPPLPEEFQIFFSVQPGEVEPGAEILGIAPEVNEAGVASTEIKAENQVAQAEVDATPRSEGIALHANQAGVASTETKVDAQVVQPEVDANHQAEAIPGGNNGNEEAPAPQDGEEDNSCFSVTPESEVPACKAIPRPPKLAPIQILAKDRSTLDPSYVFLIQTLVQDQGCLKHVPPGAAGSCRPQVRRNDFVLGAQFDTEKKLIRYNWPYLEGHKGCLGLTEEGFYMFLSGVFAHEYGHFLSLVTKDAKKRLLSIFPEYKSLKPRWQEELLADAVAGCILGRIEMSEKPLQAFIKGLGNAGADSTHPPPEVRIHVLAEGMLRCGGRALPTSVLPMLFDALNPS
ncbi:hypothetical protein F0U61_36750 [Archangium violaceum]|uniref:hypothetical protein n=1 Tax=Archangium violaceum TaxID=83451 RepID=UPI002B292695|nr:hypothetical protein F0U61_36750 [Archangium violaceum]